eukprot:8626103-Pyramimonas_sp.AAC.1
MRAEGSQLSKLDVRRRRRGLRAGVLQAQRAEAARCPGHIEGVGHLRALGNECHARVVEAQGGTSALEEAQHQGVENVGEPL